MNTIHRQILTKMRQSIPEFCNVSLHSHGYREIAGFSGLDLGAVSRNVREGTCLTESKFPVQIRTRRLMQWCQILQSHCGKVVIATDGADVVLGIRTGRRQRVCANEEVSIFQIQKKSCLWPFQPVPAVVLLPSNHEQWLSRKKKSFSAS